MRWLNMICRFQHGKRRRQDIMRIFIHHPDREFSIGDVCVTLRSHACVIYGDLVTLHRQGHLHCRMDGDTRLYSYNETEETSACLPPPRRGGAR